MTRYLTKSRFKMATGCPTRLFYTGKEEYRNSGPQENSFTQMLIDGGFQVGELAKLMFPGGHEIKAVKNADALKETKALLQRKNVILFEPAILYKDFFIRIDILIKRGKRLKLIEVKAKSYDSDSIGKGRKRDIPSGILSEVQDVAFQAYVLKKAFPDMKVSSYLMMPDKAKAATIDGLNQMFKIRRNPKTRRTRVIVNSAISKKGLGEEILALVNTDKWVEQIISSSLDFPGGTKNFVTAIRDWAKAFKRDNRLPPVIGTHCRGCEFQAESDGVKSGFHECWKEVNNWTDEDFQEDLVLDLWNFRRKDDLIQQGILKLKDVTKEHLRYRESKKGLGRAQRQWMQINGLPKGHKRNGFYLDFDLLADEMHQWRYPYHCIDFETAAVALPFNKGLPPYEPVAFQFSHHVLSKNGRVRHQTEFLLAEPGLFPNYEFVRALKAALEEDNGTVFIWASHERTVLRKIAERLACDDSPPEDADELIPFILNLIDNDHGRLVDLRTLAERASFYPDAKDSNSIKKVLPAVLNTSKFLKQKYSRPIYGADKGIKSQNYTNHAWWRAGEDGKIIAPYDQLKTDDELMPEDPAGEASDGEFQEIAEGGAAASAYTRLQFEDISKEERESIKQALLRYCELDTLAMVMVIEAWQDELKRKRKEIK